jgi:hypothetical protein
MSILFFAKVAGAGPRAGFRCAKRDGFSPTHPRVVFQRPSLLQRRTGARARAGYLPNGQAALPEHRP